MTSNPGFKVTILFKSGYLKNCAFYIVQPRIVYLLNLQCNVPLLRGSSVIAEPLDDCSCGGNILINVGPTADGMIIPIFEERLRQLGSWLQVNGEAIYSSKPWKHQNDTVTPNVWSVANALMCNRYCILNQSNYNIM